MTVTELFSLGKCVITPGAEEIMDENETLTDDLLKRHIAGDCGDMCEEDRMQNEVAIKHGFRVMSSYTVGETTLWVITEADRSATTILLPNEY
jgi:hypothetical protein